MNHPKIIQLVVWDSRLFGLASDGSLWRWGNMKSVWEFAAPGELPTQ